MDVKRQASAHPKCTLQLLSVRGASYELRNTGSCSVRPPTYRSHFVFSFWHISNGYPDTWLLRHFGTTQVDTGIWPRSFCFHVTFGHASLRHINRSSIRDFGAKLCIRTYKQGPSKQFSKKKREAKPPVFKASIFRNVKGTNDNVCQFLATFKNF